MRALARLMLLTLFGVSIWILGQSLVRLASDPTLKPFRDAAEAEIIAATDRALARAATPERLAERIAARLSEAPRNWLAIDALEALAAERAILLPADLTAAVQSARKAEAGYWSQAVTCAACAYDASQCSLDKALLCHGPVALTPVGDVLGISRAGIAYLDGSEIDQIDLALSIVGLGATAALLVSGGSSGSLKAGSALAKTARKMGLLPPRLVGMAERAVREGVDWAALPAIRSSEDLARVIRPRAFAAITDTLHDLSRVQAVTDAKTALHLLPLVDDAADARKLARSAEALKGRLVGRAEVLGKSRLFRATVRFGRTTVDLLAGLGGLMLALVGVAGALGQSLGLRLVRQFARRLAR